MNLIPGNQYYINVQYYYEDRPHWIGPFTYKNTGSNIDDIPLFYFSDIYRPYTLLGTAIKNIIPANVYKSKLLTLLRNSKT